MADDARSPRDSHRIEDDAARRARLAAQDAEFAKAGDEAAALGEDLLARGQALMGADPRLAPTPDDDAPVAAGDVEGRTDDDLVAMALARIALSSDVLAGVLSIPGYPPPFAATTADVGRYWAVPASMPLGRRMLLGAAIAARNPGAAPLAEALMARTRTTIERDSADAGTWLRTHVPAARLAAAAQLLAAEFTNFTSAVNVALQTGTPDEARAAFMRAVHDAAKASRTPRR